MTENTKTLTFAGTALTVLLLALFVSRPQRVGDALPPDMNQPFFPKFDDPLAAKSLEIIDYNEETGERSAFEVAQDSKGVWSIPSHGGYPADAERQLAQAAASIIDLKKGTLESTDPKMQEDYGVVAPPSADANADRSSSPGKGVGKQVTFKDKNGNVLAQLIIGKEVKNSPASAHPEGPGPTPLRYVRLPGSDAVYSTAVKTNRLSTKFDDWIEKDLLKMKLGTHNVSQVLLKDDTVNVEKRAIEKGPESYLGFDSKTSKWSPLDLKVFDTATRKMVERKLTDGEELDQEKLNEMKNGMNDLRIADVQRKPPGLSADLQANEAFLNDQQSLISLSRRGFYPASINNQLGLFSKEGEIRCTMDDGVEYVLRFGGIAGRGKAEDLEDDKPQDEKADQKPGDTDAKKADKTADARRFLFVAVEFNENMIPKPQLEAHPDDVKVFGPSRTAPPAEPKKDAPASEPKTDAKPDESKKPEPKKGDAKNSDKDADEEEDDVKDADDKKPAETKSEDKPSAETKGDEKKAEDKKTEDKKPEEKAEDKTPVDPERARIERENKVKQDEYDAKVKKGKDRVAELNRRFADWYYVIADKTYQKIHLTQASIIKKATPPAGEEKAATPDLLKQNPGDPFLKGPLGGGAAPPSTQATTPAAPKTPAAPAKPGGTNKAAPPKTGAKK